MTNKPNKALSPDEEARPGKPGSGDKAPAAPDADQGTGTPASHGHQKAIDGQEFAGLLEVLRGIDTGPWGGIFGKKESEAAARLIRRDLVEKQIADALKVSPGKFHRRVRKVYRKLEVHSRGAAIHALTAENPAPKRTHRNS